VRKRGALRSRVTEVVIAKPDRRPRRASGEPMSWVHGCLSSVIDGGQDVCLPEPHRWAARTAAG